MDNQHNILAFQDKANKPIKCCFLLNHQHVKWVKKVHRKWTYNGAINCDFWLAHSFIDSFPHLI